MVGRAMLPVGMAALALQLAAAPLRAQADGAGGVWSYDALAIGVDEESVEGVQDAGAVNVLYGSAGGLTSAGSQVWHRNSPGILGNAIAGAELGSAVVWGDFDDDGFPDLAIGAPNVPVGTVSVIYGATDGLSQFGNQFWSPTSSGIEGDADIGDEWGEALAAADFDGDGFDDLAVGAPFDSAPGFAGGAVTVIYGSASGLASAGNQLWHQGSPGVVGIPNEFEKFGDALAAGDFDGDGFADLAVGLSGEGSVNLLYGSAAGLSAAGNQLLQTFGSETLTTGDFDGDDRDDLAIGLVGDGPDGGAVRVFYGCAAGICEAGTELWHQDRPGVPGVAESGDNFGRGLASGDFDGDGRDDLAVGAPGKTVGGHTDAGSVTVIYGSASGLTGSGAEKWTQFTPGIDGQPEDGNLFGWSLAAADFDGDGRDDLAAAAPFHDVDGESAGTVNVIYGCATGLCTAGDQLWSQGSPGVPGVPETPDHFGFALDGSS